MVEAVRQVAVLAGGRSVRMGVDKAGVRVGGVMMLERVVRTALEMGMGSEVMVIGRAAGPEGWAGDLGVGRVRFLADRGEAFAGPVGGVVTALEEARRAVLVLGCDMPLVRVGTLRGLVVEHEGAVGERWGTMAVSRDVGGEVFGEPMLAVYTPEILPRLEEMMRTGRKSLQGLLKEKGMGRWEIPAGARGELLNVNDGGAVAEAERVLNGVKNKSQKKVKE